MKSATRARTSGLFEVCGGPSFGPKPFDVPCGVWVGVQLTLLTSSGRVLGVTRTAHGGKFSFKVAPGRYTLVARVGSGRGIHNIGHGYLIGRATWRAGPGKVMRVRILDNGIA